VPTPRRRSPAPFVQSSAARIITAPVPKAKPAVYVRRVRGMGRGVFAGRPFRKGEVIEVCPVVPLPRPQVKKCEGDALDLYIFEWPKRGFPAAVVLGFGSLYNHSADANATFTPRPAADAMVFRAARPIAPGEQIFIDYEWPGRDYQFDVTPRSAKWKGNS
jgi:SET domain-containing protein